MKQYYQKYDRFPVHKETIRIYSPDNVNAGMADILNKQDKFAAFDLANESGLSKYLIQKFQRGNAKGNSRIYDLWMATHIIDNPKFAKIKTNRKKITLLNPNKLRDQLRQSKITDEDIKKFIQDTFSMEKVIYNIQSKNRKTLTWDVLVALTACHQYFSEPRIVKENEMIRLAPNTRSLRRKNELIERYRSGDLSPVQSQAGKTS